MVVKVLSDGVAEGAGDDLLARPNFPGAPRQKPRLPTRGPAKSATRDLVRYEKGADHAGVMVALRVPPFAARRVALDIPGAEPADDLHVTLVYLGRAADVDPAKLTALRAGVADVAARTPPLSGAIRGYGRFRKPADGDTGEAEDVIWVGLDSPDLPDLRHAVLQACRGAGLEPAGDHGFTPHVTLAYVDAGEGEDSMPPDVRVTIKHLTLVVAGEETAHRLAGKPDGERPQRTLPESTFSTVMRPKVEAFTTVEALEEWAQGKGDLLVRADVSGPDCVVVKKGGDVSVAVRGWDRELVRLDDLVHAMGRVDHDYIACGKLQARDLEGKYISDPGELEGVLSAEEVASPVFMPCDILALDGDLTERPAGERWELMRSMVSEAGGHVVVPVQIICTTGDELEACVDRAMRWKPSDDEKGPPAGRAQFASGVSVVPAGSKYTHGETDDMARLVLKVEKYSEDQDRDDRGRWVGGVAPPAPPGEWERHLRAHGLPVYHTTNQKTANYILQDGLKTGEVWAGRPPSVYFTDSLEGAKYYATFNPNVSSGHYAVVEFRAPDDAVPDENDRRLFGPREFDPLGSPLQSAGSAGLAASSRVEHGIPPEDIVAVHFFDRSMLSDELEETVVRRGERNPYDVKELVPLAKAEGRLGFAVVVLGGVEKYSPDQDRDESGKWTETGAGADSGGAVTVPEGTKLVRPGEIESLAAGKQAGLSGWGLPDGSVVVFAGEHGQHISVASEMGYGGPATRSGRTGAISAAYAAGNVRLRVIDETASHPEGRIYLDFRGERGRLAAVEILRGMQGSDKSVTVDGDPGEVGFWRSTRGALRDLRAGHWVVEDAPARKRAEDFLDVEKYSEDQYEKQFGFGAGPGPGEPPDWQDHLSDQRRKPNFLSPERKYSEDQPRDEDGKWSETGAGGGGSVPRGTTLPLITYTGHPEWPRGWWHNQGSDTFHEVTSDGGPGDHMGFLWAQEGGNAKALGLDEKDVAAFKEQYESGEPTDAGADATAKAMRANTRVMYIAGNPRVDPEGSQTEQPTYAGPARREPTVAIESRVPDREETLRRAQHVLRKFGETNLQTAGARVIIENIVADDAQVNASVDSVLDARSWRDLERRVGREGYKSKDAFTTAGTSGILAPQQGRFRRPRKWEGDNVSVGVPLTFLPRAGTGPRRPRVGDEAFPHYPTPGVRKAGDGDSFAVGAGAVGGHTFVVGRLKDGEFVPDPDHPRVNPYEAIFRRGVRVVSNVLSRMTEEMGYGDAPGDKKKPRKYPDLGAEMGSSDSYDVKSEGARGPSVLERMTVEAGYAGGPTYLTPWDMVEKSDEPIYLTEKDYDESEHPRDESGRWAGSGGEASAAGGVAVEPVTPKGAVRQRILDVPFESEDVTAWGLEGGDVIRYPGSQPPSDHAELAMEMGYDFPGRDRLDPDNPDTPGDVMRGTVNASFAAGNVRIRSIRSTVRIPDGYAYMEFRGDAGLQTAKEMLAGMSAAGYGQPVRVDGSGDRTGWWSDPRRALRDIRAGKWGANEAPMKSVEKYSEDQERDERGRWTSGGAGAELGEPGRDPRKVGLMWGAAEPERAEPTPEEAHGVDGKVRLKRCYDTAGRYMLDLDVRDRMVGAGPPIKGSSVTLVHGTVTIGGVPIGHGWVEIVRPDGTAVVYDGVQGKFYDKASYYRNMRAVDEHRYDRAGALKMMLKTENYGPWERTAGLTSGPVKFADGTTSRSGWEGLLEARGLSREAADRQEWLEHGDD